MNREMLLRSVLAALLLPAALSAQSRAYAKFGASGETVGLYNLSEESCGEPRTFEGAVGSFNSWKGRTDIRFRFSIDIRGGHRSFEFTLGIDEISQSDVRGLISRTQRVRIRACRNSGRYWAAHEITRANGY